MTLHIAPELLALIRAHGEEHYPEEGAGLLLGLVNGDVRQAVRALPQTNRAPAESRPRRYEIEALAMLAAEELAEREALEVVGVFHSHPDHPAEPSGFDRERALPWYTYVITSVKDGQAGETRCWRLTEDRNSLEEERLWVGSLDPVVKEDT
ncbi:MAG: M67 family metallopeptidase [Anaerolineales bacterium]